MMTRRTFVGTVGCLTAAAGLGLGITRHQRRRLALADFAPATVRSLQGTTVSLQSLAGDRLKATVEDVHTACHRKRPGAPGTEQISLLLAPTGTDFAGGTYRVRSADLDLGHLEFSAVGPQGRQRRLEAVITRIV